MIVAVVTVALVVLVLYLDKLVEIAEARRRNDEFLTGKPHA